MNRSLWVKVNKEYPEEVKLYEHFPNSGIVHMPGRRFPTIAIQGDTLSSMWSTAMKMLEKGKKYKDDKLYYSAFDLIKQFREQLAHYEEILESEGFERPCTVVARKLNIVDDFDNT